MAGVVKKGYLDIKKKKGKIGSVSTPLLNQ